MPLNVRIERIQEAEGEIATLTSEESRMRGIYMQDGVIDDTEQAALDRIKQKIDRLSAAVQRLRAEVEENRRIWETHAAEWTLAQNRLDALQTFGHPDAGAMATSVGEVTQAVTDQRWADATLAFQQVQTNMDPIWADYERQAAARDAYEPRRADLDRRLAGAEAAEPQTEAISGPLGQVRANLAGLDAAVTARDYVAALDLLPALETELEAAEAEIVRVQQAKADYETALAALQPRLTDASVCEYATLAERQAALLTLQETMESAAAAHDYETAQATLDELSTAVDAFLAERAALDTARAEYEAKLASLRGRLAAASVSEIASTAELQQAIIDAEARMTAAAEAEDYVEALRLAGEVETALTAYEAVMEDRDLYEARLAAMHDELMAASVSDPRWGYLEPILAEMATIQTEMETAAAAEDYATALDRIAALEAKLAEFHAAIEAKRAEYEAARAALDPRYEHLATCAYPLAAEKAAAESALAEVDVAVAEEDWAGAIEAVTRAGSTLDAFDTAHQAHDATLRGQINAELPALRAAIAEPGAGETSTGQNLTRLIAQLDGALGRTDDLDTMIPVLDRAKEMVTELATVRRINEGLAADTDDDEAALALFEEFKRNGQLGDLPLEARNLLVENLLEDQGLFDTIDDTERVAVQEIWASAATLDPTFEAFDRETTGRIVSTLENDPQVQQYAANWSAMDNAQKQAAMQHVGSIIGGDQGWQLEGVEDIQYSVDGGSCPDKPRLMGWHREGGVFRDEEISVCMCNTFGDWNPSTDFADVVLNLTHEVGHGYQEQLIDRFESGDLSPGDPEYEQARMLSLDRRYFDEFPDDYDVWDVYVHSPMEQHSRHTSNHVRGELPAGFGAGHTQSVN